MKPLPSIAEWVSNWKFDPRRLHDNAAFRDHYLFPRDDVPVALAGSHTRFKDIGVAQVIATYNNPNFVHPFPVCQYTVKNSLVVVLVSTERDWKVSVHRLTGAVVVSPHGLFDPAKCVTTDIHEVLRYEPYALNKSKFSLELRTTFDVYMFLRLVASSLGFLYD